MSFYGPDAVWDLSPGGLGVFRGRAAIRESMEDWFGSFDEIETQLEEVVDLGGGVAFIVVNQKGRLAGSESDVKVRYAAVSVCVDGLIESMTNYLDIDEARAAAERLAQERRLMAEESTTSDLVELVHRCLGHEAPGLDASMRFTTHDVVLDDADHRSRRPRTQTLFALSGRLARRL